MTDAPTTEPEAESTEDLPTEPEETVKPTAEPDPVEVEETEDEPDTFPRSVVEKLRKENAGYREKARKAEDYARELFHARVAATGRLADPEDLPFDEALLDDRDALLAAVEDLLARKPHMGNRTPRGDVGQGLSGSSASVDLAGILRSRA
ncbi:hypothetical protein N5P18_15675 [Janibacter terrae]|uniref:Scaffolding protein n=1 Tax=Janibacter terrae TaxID=103817 RepID=A0ABZ2FCQ2_9MICO